MAIKANIARSKITLKTKLFDLTLKEINEIEEKRLNVVIFGLPETQTQDRSTARDLDVG